MRCSSLPSEAPRRPDRIREPSPISQKGSRARPTTSYRCWSSGSSANDASNDEQPMTSTTDAKLRDLVKQLTIELDRSNTLLADSEARSHEPIAIVAMSCRYPGDVRTPDDLWRLLIG